jgi:hypothetical protein
MLCVSFLNAFRPDFVDPEEKEQATFLGEEMLRRAAEPNELHRLVTEGLISFRKITTWKPVRDADIVPDFPVLDEQELETICLGVYQIKQARRYTAEHLNPDGDYDFLVHKNVDNLLLIKIQSRHHSRLVYKALVKYDATGPPGKRVSWFCECKSGLRTCGCCAHIASVIWYLGYARHKPSHAVAKRDPFTFLWDAGASPPEPPQVYQGAVM